VNDDGDAARNAAGDNYAGESASAQTTKGRYWPGPRIVALVARAID